MCGWIYKNGLILTDSEAQLDNLIIENNFLHGIEMEWSNPIITNSIIRNNVSDMADGDYSYSGIYMQFSNPHISNTRIVDNNYFGLQAVEYSNPIIINNTIANNSVNITSFNSNMIILNSIVLNDDYHYYNSSYWYVFLGAKWMVMSEFRNFKSCSLL